MKTKTSLNKKLFFLFSLLLLAFSSFAQNELDKLLPIDENVVTGVLKNGIRYYIRHNSKPEKRAELRLVINAGSTSEDDNQQGLAHLTEHMAFNGSKNFKKNELVDYLESIGTKFGPHLNAYTSFDETVYMIQLPTDQQSIINKGLQILEDWAHNLTFDSVEVEKERGVVVEEWRLGQGANERMRRKYWPLLFMDSRYAVRLPIGKKEIIEKCPQAVLKRFYSDWYRPDLMAVIAVGDFDVKQMEEKIKAQFSEIPVKRDSRILQTYTIPENKDLIIATATDRETKRTDVELIFKQPKENEKTVGDYRRGLAQQLFIQMMNARTNELLRKANPPFLATNSSFSNLVRNQYAYSCSATCSEDSIEKALLALVSENERVRRYGFTKSELIRQKSELLRGMEMAYSEKNKTESRNFAREYVSNFLNGEPIPGIEYEYNLTKKYVDGITLEEINAFSNQWISNGKNCIAIITAPDKETTRIPSDDRIKNILASMQSLDLKPYDDKVSDKPLLDKIPTGSKVTYEKKTEEYNITEWILANGVKIIVKPTDFKNDQILFSSYSWGGWSGYPDNKFLSAANADEIIEESGIGDYDANELEKKLSGKIVSCSPYISELQQGFSGSCSPTDLETLMQLIYSYVVYPRIDSIAFNALMENRKTYLQNKNADPATVFSDTVGYVMSGYNYHNRPANPEMLKEINLQMALEIYKERFSNAASSVYFFVGNFNIDTLKKMAEKYLGGLPSNHSRESWQDIGANPPNGYVERTVKMGQEPKSSVILRWHIPFEYNRSNRNEVNVLNKLINIRLREVLREEKSGVYGVSFVSSPHHYPDQQLEQVVYFSCSPDNVNMLINSALEVLKEIKVKGCEEKNLVKVKETALRERETYLKENSFWLNVLSSNSQNGEDVLDLLKYNDWVKGLKGFDFLEFSKKYLQMDNYAKFVLMPKEGVGK